MKILVVAHKDFDDTIVPRDGYQVIKVGSGLVSADALAKNWLTDDTGDNIARQNPYYCELTAHYWAWKNLHDVDIVGLSHYRRYFMDYKNTPDFRDNILSVKKIHEIFGRYHAVMPFWEKKVGDWLYLYEDRPAEQQNPDLRLLHQIIAERYPAVLPSFDRVTRGKYLCYGNMIVLAKADFDEYSAFLFDVLGRYDEAIRKSGAHYMLRIDGYLSETLLPVWVGYRFRERDIWRTDVVNCETRRWQPKTLLGRLRVWHSLLCLVRWIQVRMN